MVSSHRLVRVAFNKEGELFVIDIGRHQIHVFDCEGELVDSIPDKPFEGYEDGEFDEPFGLCFSGDWKHIFDCDSQSTRSCANTCPVVPSIC